MKGIVRIHMSLGELAGEELSGEIIVVVSRNAGLCVYDYVRFRS